MEERKISVWVCREEKLVSGVTRRTSCADVVRVLLEDRSSPALAGSARSYCMVEKWRGFERVLPHRTKILRLWTAWGREQDNVRFVLVRSDASLPGSGPRSAEARVVHSKESRCGDDREPGTPEVLIAGEDISQEKRRRVVRKAFRKLEKIKKKKKKKEDEEEEVEEEEEVDTCAEKMETLVHLVLSQDHTIRQQTQRIAELDGEIERHEARVHNDRMRRHGTNYVQDTYLMDAGDGDGVSAELDADTMARCDQLIQLQERITEQHALLERLIWEVHEELDRRWTTRRREGDAAETHETPASGPDVRLEEDTIRTHLDTSSCIGLRLHTELEAVHGQLALSRDLWEAKERELRDLLQKLEPRDGCGEGDAVFADDVQTSPPPPSASVDHTDCWVERVRGLPKANPSGNDDDSDTGLSSMHSQDSDHAAVCESLV